MDGYIKGFHTIVYMDHKNNLYSEAQLDNRRRSKQMSNWALELQQYTECGSGGKRISWLTPRVGRHGRLRWLDT